MSRKIYQLFVFLMVHWSTLQGQFPVYSYTLPLPDLNMRFKASKAGDILAGAWRPGNDFNAVLMKWNTRDELAWIKKESNPDWNLWDVTPLSDGNWVYLKKHRDSTNWVELTKISPQGNLIWNRRYRLQSSISFESQLISLEKTGGFQLNAFHSLTQFDNSGKLLWSKSLAKGVFVAGVQRSDGMVLLLTQEESGRASLLLLNESGRVIKQYRMVELTLDASFGALHSLPDGGCLIQVLDRNVTRLISVDGNLRPLWGKELPQDGLFRGGIISGSGAILLPYQDSGKTHAIAFDKYGDYLWSLKLQNPRVNSEITYGIPFLKGWKCFEFAVNQGPTINYILLKLPETWTPETCFSTSGSRVTFKDIQLSLSTVALPLNHFLLEEIPSSTPEYFQIESLRQLECEVPNPGFEICNNGIDDNGDEVIDCADPTCTCADCSQFLAETQLSTLDLGPDRVLCSDSSLHISVPIFPGLTYQWNTGASSSSIMVNQSGVYGLEISNKEGNCTWRDSIRVEFEECKAFAVYVPNVMSLSSTSNQRFGPFFSSKPALISYQFDIFNRWGEKVFQSKDQHASWDGMKRGEKCAQGIYVWTLRVQYQDRGQTKEVFKYGQVLLIQ